MQKNAIKIAVSQYEIEQLPSWQAYEDKIVRLVEQVKNENADLLIFGEYAGLELASWYLKSLEEQFNYIQSILMEHQALYSSLAKEYNLYIQPGTLPVKGEDGFYRNRAYLFSPQGPIAYQDKIFLTPFELQTQLFRPGDTLQVFKTPIGNLGITICYDSEFPSLTHQLIRSDVHLLLVPCCTEKMTGLIRTAIASQARAIENQCYVAQSCLIGKASWCDLIDINTGQSSIYCPADSGFPETGICAQTQLNTPMLIYADLSWEKLEYVRNHGEMRNFHDSQKDIQPILKSIRMTAL